MEKLIFQDAPEGAQRQAMLEANSHSVEEQPVKEFFAEDEILQKRKKFADNAIEIRREEEKLAKLKAQSKGIIKPLQEENKSLLTDIRQGFVEVEQPVYLIADHVNGMMGYYDAKGELISSRKLMPSERQMNVFAIDKKDGTNN